MSGWQPIETAPRDGSEILAFAPTTKDGTCRVYYVRWDGQRWVGEDCLPEALTDWMPKP